jgi:hypothetical protein
MSRYSRKLAKDRAHELPLLRFEIDEVVEILRMSRAQVYNRIAEGAIRVQKDGARTYVTLTELERYVEDCERHAPPEEPSEQAVSPTDARPSGRRAREARRDEERAYGVSRRGRP